MKNSTNYSTNKLDCLLRTNEYRFQAIEHGIIDTPWEWLLTSIEYKRSHLKCLEKSLFQIEQLMESLWVSYRHNPVPLLKKLGIPAWIHRFVALDEVSTPMPLRWDAIYSGDQWKILEINTGFCLGGLNSSSINDFRAIFYSHSAPFLRITPLHNAFQSLSYHIYDIVADDVTIIPVIETPEGYKKYSFYLDSFVLNMNKNGSILYIAGTLDDFHVIENSVLFKGYKVTHFIPMFTLNELSESQFKENIFLKILHEKKIISLLGFREMIFSNKAFIPLLIKYAIATLPNEHAREIENIFPMGDLLTKENVTSFYERNFILKPAEGYGGADIVCSWLCNSDEWIRSLHDALSSGSLWVVQERIIGNLSYMQSIDAQGKIKEGNSSVVHGFITLRGKMIGNLTRALIGIHEPGVINGHKGAAIGLSGLY
ncbi:hypothetical protein QT13_14935 [Pectobacterium brasiliense]|uniref:hypothetical protein n=1 Tax=Pectobacterium brasiliense TaxID=180957 RepID=UPI00057DBBEC|nr:hypothetical protein [Pectobacterium brasiliense]KHS67087.1 hypothetical protein QT13_14935 [Pectobacterium brasiliense]KHS87123.1 hypothetical protein RC83_13505 [Pectobacterium brasiliense]